MNYWWLQIDSLVTFSLLSIRSTPLTLVMKLFSFVGSELFLIPATIWFSIRWHLSGYKTEAKILLVSMIMGTAVGKILKDFFSRERPVISPLATENTYGFPSGHTVSSTIFFLTIAFLVNSSTTVRCVSITAIILIALSRIYLGVHYLSDVIAGFVLGVIFFLVNKMLLNRH